MNTSSSLLGIDRKFVIVSVTREKLDARDDEE